MKQFSFTRVNRDAAGCSPCVYTMKEEGGEHRVRMGRGGNASAGEPLTGDHKQSVINKEGEEVKP